MAMNLVLNEDQEKYLQEIMQRHDIKTKSKCIKELIESDKRNHEYIDMLEKKCNDYEKEYTELVVLLRRKNKVENDIFELMTNTALVKEYLL